MRMVSIGYRFQVYNQMFNARSTACFIRRNVQLFKNHRKPPYHGKILGGSVSSFFYPAMSGTTSRDPQHRADDDDDLPQGLKILSRCAEYLVKLVESPRSVPCAPGISLDMKGQLETVASTIRSAWSNRG